MKHILIVGLIVAVGSCTSNSNPPGATARPSSKADSAATLVSPTLSTDSAIAFIRTAYQQINAAPLTNQPFKWTATNCNNEGTATYYLDAHNQIVKVVETGTIGDGAWTTAYYYVKGKFIFSLSTEVGGPAAGPDMTTIYRKYVYDDNVIRTMENETYTTPSNEVLTPASKEYKIVKAYGNKNFEAAFCD